jgi:hypothetical protein
MVGFGSLMVASHQGIWSLRLLLTIGSGCNVLASLVVLPGLLRLLTRPEVAAPHAMRSSAACPLVTEDRVRGSPRPVSCAGPLFIVD